MAFKHVTEAELGTWLSDRPAGVPIVLQDKNTGQFVAHGRLRHDDFLKSVETGLCSFYAQMGGSGVFACSDWFRQDQPAAVMAHVKIEKDSAAPPLQLFRALDHLQQILHQRNVERPEGSYSAKLFKAGVAQIAKKLGEEGVEVALAAVAEDKTRLTEESADLLYNLFMLLEATGLSADQVGDALIRRA